MRTKAKSATQKATKASRPLTRFDLRDVHQAIDLFDRKIAYLQKFETFDSDQEKQRALDSLNTKREKLVASASEMIADGITFDVADLPRSMRSTPEASEQKPTAEKQTIPAKPQSRFGASVASAEAEQRMPSQP